MSVIIDGSERCEVTGCEVTRALLEARQENAVLQAEVERLKVLLHEEAQQRLAADQDADAWEAEVERLKDERDRAVASTKGTYCAYCGQEYPLDDECAAAVTEHIRTCEKHPLRAAEAEIARLHVILATARVPCWECAQSDKYQNVTCPKCLDSLYVPWKEP